MNQDDWLMALARRGGRRLGRWCGRRRWQLTVSTIPALAALIIVGWWLAVPVLVGGFWLSAFGPGVSARVRDHETRKHLAACWSKAINDAFIESGLQDVKDRDGNPSRKRTTISEADVDAGNLWCVVTPACDTLKLDGPKPKGSITRNLRAPSLVDRRLSWLPKRVAWRSVEEVMFRVPNAARHHVREMIVIARPLPERLLVDTADDTGDPNVLWMGSSLHGTDGQARWNVAESPHMLIVGTTGSGKGGLFRTLTDGALQNSGFSDVIVLNPKKSGEFSEFSRFGVRVWSDPDEILAGLIELNEQREARERFLDRERVDKWSNLKNTRGQGRILVLCDEYLALVIGAKTSGKGPNVKAEIRDLIHDFALMGRSSGIHLAIAAQRPDAEHLDGAFRDQLVARVCFDASDAGRRMAFEQDPGELPAVPGRAWVQHLGDGDGSQLDICQVGFIDREVLNKRSDQTHGRRSWPTEDLVGPDLTGGVRSEAEALGSGADDVPSGLRANPTRRLKGGVFPGSPPAYEEPSGGPGVAVPLYEQPPVD